MARVPWTNLSTLWFAFYNLIHLPRAEQTEMVGKIAWRPRPSGYLLANFSEGKAEAVVI